MLLDVEIDLTKAAAPGGAARGGKYLSREWTGTRWKYDYGDQKPSGWTSKDEDATSGGSGFAVWDANATKGVDPEQTYSAGLAKALDNPGTPVTIRNPALDEDLSVTVADIKGKRFIQVKDSSGDIIGAGSSKNGMKNKGQYDKWFLGTANTHTRYDTNGNPWMDVVPQLGKVDSASGELVPSTNTARSWKVQYHPTVPKDQQRASDKDRDALGVAGSLDMAKERIDKMIVGTGGEEITLNFPSEALSTVREGDSGLTQDIEVGKFKWRYNKDKGKSGGRELDVSPEEKQQMIAAMASDYFPVLQTTAEEFTNSGKAFYGESKAERKQWTERLIGDQIPGKDERDDRNKPIFVALDPESPGYKALEQAIDEWNPNKGVPLAGMIAGKNGKIFNAMRDEDKKLKREIKGTASGSVASEDGQVSRADITADPASERQSASEEWDFDQWHSDAETAIEQIGEEQIKDAKKREETKKMARQALDEISDQPVAMQRRLASRVSAAIMEFFDDAKKSLLIEDAINRYRSEDLTWKALQVLTKDKNVDPAHQYMQADGDETLPRFYYQDPAGNYVRYTNAPTGHPDQSKYYGDAQIHPGEPTMETAPEYFTPEGQKLTRCPECEIEQVEWNQQYNRYDPQNLWAARWRNDTGDYRYSYIDSDIRNMPKLQINQQNALTDVRIPMLRQGYNTMFNTSDRIKDQMTGLAIALLDQGRFRAIELSTVCPMNVLIEGPIITIGTRRIYADHKIQAAFETLMSHKQADEPMFTIPLQKREGELEEGLYRRIGPHYLARVLDTQGTSLIGLQTYHATICFSREIQRALTNYDVSWETAKSNAMLTVALEWGHDLRVEPDVMGVMQLIEQVLVDPLVVEALQVNAQEQGLLGNDSQALPPAMPPIPNVSMDLMDRTNDEQEFSDWVHSFPIHEKADPGEIPQ